MLFKNMDLNEVIKLNKEEVGRSSKGIFADLIISYCHYLKRTRSDLTHLTCDQSNFIKYPI